ncbi:VOC family protein [Micromonospora echinofusca]|uniref:VOC family protein n=1 Tax=Micromonospora echinofusca TaxID=47858 RepID=A0ABS3VRW7_MICEH|nr:VOC family protein [Micromonospora echinofusca]MBO4207282.1 VOC family protein [Micromonospora echinofusca]
MPVQLNHTIVASRDRQESAEFLAYILGLSVGAPFGPFLPVVTSNAVTLDFATVPEDQIVPQHYAFLVSEEEFDGILDRVTLSRVDYYPDPQLSRAGQINRNDGGRGFYFLDPSGHGMEVITRPYGG